MHPFPGSFRGDLAVVAQVCADGDRTDAAETERFVRDVKKCGLREVKAPPARRTALRAMWVEGRLADVPLGN